MMKVTRHALGDARGDADAIRKDLQQMLSGDVDWRNGRLQGLNHFGGDDVLEIAEKAHRIFSSTNPVSRRAFPSVGQLQDEIIASAIKLMGGQGEECGTITSGGTESIFLAMLAARERFRLRRPDARPELVIPETAHPAFNKHAHYLDIKVIRVATGEDFRADPAAMERAFGKDTMMVVGSAPSYPCGLFDPITEIAQIALKHDVWMHVDACIGGFQAPFVKALGYHVPDFGFTVPGVCSISADLHKYGFTLKGASVVLFASEELRARSLFRFTDWPRGLYATDSFSGTRSGGPVAAAWAVMRYLGYEGYVDLNRRIMRMRDNLISGLQDLDCELVGKPELSLIAVRPRHADLAAVSDEMAKHGWILNLLLKPKGVQIMLNISHEGHMEKFADDMKRSISVAKNTAMRELSVEY